jgi:hypothetical protein
MAARSGSRGGPRRADTRARSLCDSPSNRSRDRSRRSGALHGVEGVAGFQTLDLQLSIGSLDRGCLATGRAVGASSGSMALLRDHPNYRSISIVTGRPARQALAPFSLCAYRSCRRAAVRPGSVPARERLPAARRRTAARLDGRLPPTHRTRCGRGVSPWSAGRSTGPVGRHRRDAAGSRLGHDSQSAQAARSGHRHLPRRSGAVRDPRISRHRGPNGLRAARARARRFCYVRLRKWRRG